MATNKNTQDQPNVVVKKRVAGGAVMTQSVPTPVKRPARTAKTAR